MSEFENLFHDYALVIYRFLLALCRDKDLAEELTSETLYQAYLHIGQFRGECKIETWLCQIAKNALNKELKRRGRNLQLQDDSVQNFTTEDMLFEKLSDREQAIEAHKRLHMLKEPCVTKLLYCFSKTTPKKAPDTVISFFKDCLTNHA